MKPQPLPVMRHEIAAAWLQVGNSAFRFAVIDMALINGDEDRKRFRWQCQLVEYRTLRPIKTVWRRPAFFSSVATALGWFNRTEKRIKSRLVRSRLEAA